MSASTCGIRRTSLNSTVRRERLRSSPPVSRTGYGGLVLMRELRAARYGTGGSDAWSIGSVPGVSPKAG